MFGSKETKGAVVPDVKVEYSSLDLASNYLAAFQHVFGNYGGEQGDRILSFVTAHVASNSYLLAAEEELAKLEETVMNDDLIRDFVFMMQKVFLGRWVQGRGKAVVDSLIYDVALGMTVSHLETLDEAKIVIPDAMVQTIPVIDEVIRLLSNNLWLVVVALMPIYINVADISAQVDKRQ